MRYPGGKNGAGVFQTLINQIPPHAFYIEAFVGSGAVYRQKSRCSSIVIDADAHVAARWASVAESEPDLIALHGDATSTLGIFAERQLLSSRVFIYCDPPYVRSTRRSASPIYKHEMTDEDHTRLLRLLRCLPCQIMVSGYLSELYLSQLPNWRRLDFSTMTRGGPAVESLWMNYPEPAALADYSYLGANFRERQDFKRLRERWRARLAGMSALKRQALMQALSDLAAAEPPIAAGDQGPSADLQRVAIGLIGGSGPARAGCMSEAVTPSGGSASLSVLHAKSAAKPREHCNIDRQDER